MACTSVTFFGLPTRTAGSHGYIAWKLESWYGRPQASDAAFGSMRQWNAAARVATTAVATTAASVFICGRDAGTAAFGAVGPSRWTHAGTRTSARSRTHQACVETSHGYERSLACARSVNAWSLGPRGAGKGVVRKKQHSAHRGRPHRRRSRSRDEIVLKNGCFQRSRSGRRGRDDAARSSVRTPNGKSGG